MAQTYQLVFGCCGDEVSLGSREIGKHGQHCLSCDTENPPAEVKEGRPYR